MLRQGLVGRPPGYKFLHPISLNKPTIISMDKRDSRQNRFVRDSNRKISHTPAKKKHLETGYPLKVAPLQMTHLDQVSVSADGHLSTPAVSILTLR